MSEVPTSPDQQDIVDDSYRRASALDPSRPSEFARRKLLAHAAQVAAERAVKHGASKSAPRFNAPEPETNKTKSRLILFGSLAAAVIAGILIVPPLLAPPLKPLTELPPATVSEPPETAPPVAARAPTPRAGANEPARSHEAAQIPSSRQPPEPAPPAPDRSALGSSEPPPPAPTSASALPAPQPPASSTRPLASNAAARARALSESYAPSAPPARAVSQRATAAQNRQAGGSNATEPIVKPSSAGAVAPTQSAALPQNDTRVALAAPAPVAPAPAAAPAAATQAPPAPTAPPATQKADAGTTQAASPTQLWRAAETGDLQGIQAALDANIDVNARDPQGRTALMRATRRGQTKSVQALLAHGADPNLPDGDGFTPLRVATSAGSTAIIVVLKKSGGRYYN